jgi:hypothetical protein
MAASDIEIDDQWPLGSTLQELTPGVAGALAELRPAPAAVEFCAEEGLPWITVHYDAVVAPGQVLPAGEAIARVLHRPVLFQSLRPNSIHYVIEDESFRRKGRDPALGAAAYGVPLDEVRTSWQPK